MEFLLLDVGSTLFVILVLACSTSEEIFRNSLTELLEVVNALKSLGTSMQQANTKSRRGVPIPMVKIFPVARVSTKKHKQTRMSQQRGPHIPKRGSVNTNTMTVIPMARPRIEAINKFQPSAKNLTLRVLYPK